METSRDSNIVPISVKVAVAVGAASGAAIATIRNREKLLEAAELLFHRGAEFCRQRLEERKHLNAAYASDSPDEYYDYHDERQARSTGARIYDTDDATTPDISDDEDVADTVSLD